MAERLVDEVVRTGDSRARPDFRDLPARLGGDEFAVLLVRPFRSGGRRYTVAQRILT